MEYKKETNKVENKLNIALKNALMYAVYLTVLLWFFDVLSFFTTDQKGVLSYFVVTGSIFSIHLISYGFIEKTVRDRKIKQIVSSVSYITSASLASLVSWILLKGEVAILLVVISAFVIPALLPSVGLYLIHVFKEIPVVDSVEKSAAVIEVKEEEIPQDVNFVIENESGKKLLDVPVNIIICFEANDNYVVTYYMGKEEKVKKSMERISLKKIEEILEGLQVKTFSRVHKSYLINQEQVEEIKGKAQAQKIKLKNLDVLVPVSRSFNVSTLPFEN